MKKKVAPVEEEIIPVEAMPETEIIDDLDTEIKTEGRKVGDEIELFDIAGRRYRTTITAIDEKKWQYASP